MLGPCHERRHLGLHWLRGDSPGARKLHHGAAAAGLLLRFRPAGLCAVPVHHRRRPDALGCDSDAFVRGCNADAVHRSRHADAIDFGRYASCGPCTGALGLSARREPAVGGARSLFALGWVRCCAFGQLSRSRRSAGGPG